MNHSKILAGARFHLKDGRELRFVPVPNSLVRRRTGELLFAAAALLLLGAVLFLSSLKPDNRRVRNVAPSPREAPVARLQ